MEENTLSFFCVGFVGWGKMKVCFVRWKNKFNPEALPLEAVSVVVHVIPKKVRSMHKSFKFAGRQNGIKHFSLRNQFRKPKQLTTLPNLVAIIIYREAAKPPQIIIKDFGNRYPPASITTTLKN